MSCPSGCTSQHICGDDNMFIITIMFLAFIGFSGGQMCYIVSLKRKLDDFEQSDNEEESNLLREVPPPYQGTDDI